MYVIPVHAQIFTEYTYCICSEFILIGFCEQSINSTDYIVTYNSTPSYIQSTATLRCVKGYAAIEPGFAICDSDGEWIIEYPDCEGTHICTLFLNQAHTGQHAPGFLKLVWCRCLYVCMFVRVSAPEAVNN